MVTACSREISPSLLFFPQNFVSAVSKIVFADLYGTFFSNTFIFELVIVLPFKI